MLESTQDMLAQLDQALSLKSEDSMDFTLPEHHSERINHHMKMLNYYLNEQKRMG